MLLGKKLATGRASAKLSRPPPPGRKVPPEQSAGGSGQESSPVGVTCLPQRLRVGRIRKYGRGQIAQVPASGDDMRDLANEVSGVRGHDGASPNATALVV